MQPSATQIVLKVLQLHILYGFVKVIIVKNLNPIEFLSLARGPPLWNK